MSDILLVAVSAFFGLLFVGLIVDWIGYLAYWPPVYAIGPRVFREELPTLRPPMALAGSFVDTANGRFKVEDGAVLIRHRWSLRTHDFTGRASIRWVNGTAVAEGRAAPWIPVLVVMGAVLFVLAVVTRTWQGIVVGPVISLGYGLLYMPFARKALRGLVGEYQEWATGLQSSA